MCPCLVLADQNKVISDFDVLVRFQSAVCSLCVQRILAEGGVDTGDLIVPQTLSPCRCQPAVLTALMVHRTVDETNSQHTMQSIQPYSCTTHLISHQHSGVSSREIVLCWIPSKIFAGKTISLKLPVHKMNCALQNQGLEIAPWEPDKLKRKQKCWFKKLQGLEFFKWSNCGEEDFNQYKLFPTVVGRVWWKVKYKSMTKD